MPLSKWTLAWLWYPTASATGMSDSHSVINSILTHCAVTVPQNCGKMGVILNSPIHFPGKEKHCILKREVNSSLKAGYNFQSQD